MIAACSMALGAGGGCHFGAAATGLALDSDSDWSRSVRSALSVFGPIPLASSFSMVTSSSRSLSLVLARYLASSVSVIFSSRLEDGNFINGSRLRGWVCAVAARQKTSPAQAQPLNLDQLMKFLS